MGKYDQFLVGLSSAPTSAVSAPTKTGKYDQFLTGLDAPAGSPTGSPENSERRQQSSLPVEIAARIMQPRKTYEDVQEYLPAVAGLIGTAASPAVGVLAAQGTDVLRRGANVALGIDTPTDPLSVGLGNIGQAVSAGPAQFGKGLMTALGKVGGPASKALTRSSGPYAPIKKTLESRVRDFGNKAASVANVGARSVGRSIAKGLQSTTGVSAERYAQMFNKPELPIPVVSPIRRHFAGKGVERALAKEGFDAAKSGKEVFDPLLSQARRDAIRASDLAERAINKPGQVVTPDEIRAIGTDLVKGKRAISRVIRGTSYKDRASIPDMVEKARKVDQVLSGLSPEVKQAMTKYSQAAMADEFSNILPRVMSGNVSYVKSLVPAFAALGGSIAPGGAALGVMSSPLLMGSATALAGVINKAMKVPELRRIILSQISQEATGE